MLVNFIKNTGIIIFIFCGSIWLNKLDNNIYENQLGVYLPFSAMAEEATNNKVVEMTLGENEAPISIVEYAAYTCIHCATFHNDIFPQLKSEYIDTGKVNFTYREFFLHRWGLWGSLIARCANDDQKVFFGVTDRIYKKRDAWINKNDDDQAAIFELKNLPEEPKLSTEYLARSPKPKNKSNFLIFAYSPISL